MISKNKPGFSCNGYAGFFLAVGGGSLRERIALSRILHRDQAIFLEITSDEVSQRHPHALNIPTPISPIRP